MTLGSGESSGDGPFEVLAWGLVPLLVDATRAHRPSASDSISGVVRLPKNRVRIFVRLSRGRDSDAVAVAIEFDLMRHGVPLDDGAAITFVRTVSAQQVEGLRPSDRPRDSHGYTVISASELGFLHDAQPSAPDVDLFRALTVLVWGPGHPISEDVFSLAGMILTDDDDLRLYIKMSGTGETLGVELPTREQAGRRRISSAAIAHELTSLAGLSFDGPRRREASDDYASETIDMVDWLN